MKLEKKYLYLTTVVAVILLSFIGTAVYQMQHERYAPVYIDMQALQKTQISSEELRAFLKTWIKYCEDEGHHPEIPQLSYDTTDGKSQLDPALSTWLSNRGWDVNRFIYIDNRLRIIMSTIMRDKEILKKQQLMKDGAINSGNPAVSETLRREAQAQQKNLNIEKISAEERHMVEPQLEALRTLLKEPKI